MGKMQILPKKGFTQYMVRSPPGVHNKYYETLVREIKAGFAVLGQSTTRTTAGPFGRPQNGIEYTQQQYAWSQHTLLLRIFSIGIRNVHGAALSPENKKGPE